MSEKYYVIQVLTGKEELFKTRALDIIDNFKFNVLFPKRKLFHRKNGKEFVKEVPVYPGYIFLKTSEFTSYICDFIKKLPGFVHFLYNNKDIRPVSDDESRFISDLLKDGEIAELSQVVFEKDGKVKVLKGPLLGKEGDIVKVDKRKKRIKVRMDLYNKTFKIDFGFEEVSALDVE